MRMIAALMREQGLPSPFAISRPFHIEEVELDGPGRGEVLVEVRAAGLCHSDLSVIEGLRTRPLPVVGGHEGAGIVREVGSGVADVEPGDHVAITTVSGCDHCRVCLRGRPNLCRSLGTAREEGTLGNGARRLRFPNGDRLNHYGGVSVFAQFAVVTPQSLVKIDKAVPFDVAAVLGCAVITGAGAVLNSAQVKPGDTVAVIGLGGVGLAAVMAAKEAGAAKIIGIDVLSSKFALAREVGATHCVDARSAHATQEILAITDGGVDYAFEISGNLSALESAAKIVAPGGEVVGVGVGRTDARFTVEHLPWVTGEKVLRGSYMGGGSPQHDLPRYIDLYLGGRLPIDRLLSSRIAFDQLNEGFDRLNESAAIRQILLPHDEAA